MDPLRYTGRMGKSKDKKTLVQYAALPFLVMENGQTLVLLITSRETRRWIIPKGRPEKRLAPHEVAEREALEEAGVIGRVQEKAFTVFRSEKRLKTGEVRATRVQVHLLEVDRELDKWDEQHERERRWVSPAEAAMLVSEPGLVPVFLKIAAPVG